MTLICVFSFFFSCLLGQETICIWNIRLPGLTFLNGEYHLDSRYVSGKPTYNRTIPGQYLNNPSDTTLYVTPGIHGKYIILKYVNFIICVSLNVYHEIIHC